MNTKHTPGPWKYIAWHGQHGVHDAMDNDVCETFGEDAEANARLIAAAPELLEALEEIVEGAIKHQGSSDMRVTAYAMHMVRAAIDKATKP